MVTVGVASYNNGKYICKTLDSIADQSYKDIQLIIVDDCSIDNSVEVIEHWLLEHSDFNVQFFVHKSNRGICAVCNTILSHASGKYLSLVGSDDIYIKDKIEKQVQEFNNLTAEYAVVYSDMFLIDENDKEFTDTDMLSNSSGFLPIEGDIFKLLINYNIITAPSVMMITQAVREVGGYDEELSFEDWDMWLRLSKRFKVKFSSFISVKYRKLPSSASNNKNLKYYESCIRLQIKHLGYDSNTDYIIYRNVSEYAQLIYKLIGVQASPWLNTAFKIRPGLKIGLLALLASLRIPYSLYSSLANIKKWLAHEKLT